MQTLCTNERMWIEVIFSQNINACYVFDKYAKYSNKIIRIDKVLGVLGTLVNVVALIALMCNDENNCFERTTDTETLYLT